MNFVRQSTFAAIVFLVWTGISFGQEVQEFTLNNVYATLGSGQTSGKPEVGFIIEGSLASQMFSKMKSQEKKDDCTGGTYKQDPSGLTCTHDPSGNIHQCSFGYLFETGSLTAGPLTC